MADKDAVARAKALKAIKGYTKSAKKADVSLPDRLLGYLQSGKQTATEQAEAAGGAVLKTLDFLNRPSQAVLKGIQAQQTGTDISDAIEAGIKGQGDTINLRAALNTDNFQTGKGYINKDAQSAAARQGGRALGAVDLVGTIATDPTTLVGGTGGLSKAGRKVAEDVLEKSASRKLADKGVKALSPEETSALTEGLARYGGSDKFVERTLKALEQPQGITLAGKTILPTAKGTRAAKAVFESTPVGKAISNKASKLADTVSPDGALRQAGMLAKEGASRSRRIARAEPNALRSEVDAKFNSVLRGGSISPEDNELINNALHTGAIDEAVDALRQSGSKQAAETLEFIGKELRPTLSARQVEAGTVKPSELRVDETYDPRIITPEAREYLKQNPDVARNVFNGQYQDPTLLRSKGVSFRTFMPDASIREANDTFMGANPEFKGRLFEEDAVKRWYGKAEQVARDLEASTIVRELKQVRTGGAGKGGKALLVDGWDPAKMKEIKSGTKLASDLLKSDTKKWTRRNTANKAALTAVRKQIAELETVRARLTKEGYGAAFKRDAQRIGDKRSGRSDAVARAATTATAKANAKEARQVAARLETLKNQQDRLKSRDFNIEREKPGPTNVEWRKVETKREKEAQAAYERDLIDKGYVKVNTGSTGEKWALKEVANYLQEFAEAQTPERLGQFGKVMQTWTQLWKAYATVPVLFGAGFHTRNAAGNVWNMFIHGFNDPRYFVDANRAATTIRLGLRKGISTETAITDSNLPPDVKEGVLAALKEGVVDSSFFHSDFAKHAPTSSRKTRALQNINLASTDNAAIKSGRAIGSYIEDSSRLAMFLSEYGKHGSAQQAARRTKEALFDYADLSKFDTDLKKYVPFWTFMSRNVPAQVRGIMENPARALVPAKAEAQGQATDDGDTSILPQYALQAGQRKLFSQGDNAILGGVQLPQAAAIQQFAPLTDLLGDRPDEGRITAASASFGQNFGGGPLALLRALTENAAGKSSFSNAPLDTGEKQTRNILSAFNPLATKGYTTINNVKDPEKRTQAALSALGVSSTTVTPKTETGELYRRGEALRKFNKQNGVESSSAKTGSSSRKRKASDYPRP